MSTVRRKPAETRPVKYLHFKSYQTNKTQALGQQPLSTRSTTTNGADKAPNTKLSINASNGGSKPVKKTKAHVSPTKPHHSAISPTIHRKMKADFEKLESQANIWKEDNIELRMINSDMLFTNEDLKQRLKQVQLQNEELTDRLELDRDQIQSLTESNEKKISELEQLQSSIASMELEKKVVSARAEEMQTMNKELRNLLTELKAASEKKDQTIESLSGFKEKCESHSAKLQAALAENEKLVNQITSNQKYVDLLDGNVRKLEEKNRELHDKNELLTKVIAEKKRSEENLRQKYDQLKKENKIFKEMETRYLLHDRVGMTANRFPTIASHQVVSSMLDRETLPGRDCTCNSGQNTSKGLGKPSRSHAKPAYHQIYNLQHQSAEANGKSRRH